MVTLSDEAKLPLKAIALLPLASCLLPLASYLLPAPCSLLPKNPKLCT
ncbi:MAG: hypothetical protein F6K26_40055 [Moorea sp. SIO2I5]|nr:hypothetical protein [Moorena sp. SIO2I5]